MQDIDINIIIPCYYPSSIIDPCFKSLSNQTAKNKIKIFMINDCSPNTNCEYLDIRQKYSDLNIQYLRTKQNSGPGSSRQLGLNSIDNNANWVMFLDDDDQLADNHVIENYLSLIKKETSNQKLAFLSGKRKFLYKDKENDDGFCGLTGSLFNINIIRLFNLRFLDIWYDEDSLFFVQFFYYASVLENILLKFDIKLEFINDESFFSYCYNSVNDLSITHQIHSDKEFYTFLFSFYMISFLEPLLSIPLFQESAFKEIKLYFIYIIIYSMLFIDNQNDICNSTKILIKKANDKMFLIMNNYPNTIIQQTDLNLMSEWNEYISKFKYLIEKFNNIYSYKNYYNLLELGENI